MAGQGCIEAPPAGEGVQTQRAERGVQAKAD